MLVYMCLNEEVQECLEVGYSDEGCMFDSIKEWIEHDFNIILKEYGIDTEKELACIIIKSYIEGRYEFIVSTENRIFEASY